MWKFISVVETRCLFKIKSYGNGIISLWGPQISPNMQFPSQQRPLLGIILWSDVKRISAQQPAADCTSGWPVSDPSSLDWQPATILYRTIQRKRHETKACSWTLKAIHTWPYSSVCSDICVYGWRKTWSPGDIWSMPNAITAWQGRSW